MSVQLINETRRRVEIPITWTAGREKQNWRGDGMSVGTPFIKNSSPKFVLASTSLASGKNRRRSAPLN
jgi:hypothetical protein